MSAAFFAKIQERTAKGLTGALNEIKSVVNKNHRHDEEHEVEADRIRAAVNESHRFKSFSDVREGNAVKWYIDGHDYFWAVSEIISSARECIMIQDWWLTPELYLRRPPAKYPEWRIDRLLKSKAQQGVKVYIIVYKEVVQGMNMSSRHTKDSFNELHPNIAVIRHPDHVGSIDSTRFWSHHEKVVIVDNYWACIGGLDLCFGRWDTHTHPLADCHPTDFSQTLFPGQEYNNARVLDFKDVWNFTDNAVSILETPRMPWHDVHMSLVGPSVLDIVQHFTERWNELKYRKYAEKDRYDWLTYPHNSGLNPNDSIALLLKREEWLLGKKYRQLYEKGPDFVPQENDHPHEYPLGSCKVQVVRSCSDWSHGVLKEQSIQNAYIELIREAEHYIYIENQFFISSTGESPQIQNLIAQALVERILRAAKEGARFKVVVLLPEVPGFAGDIATSSDVKTILAATWRTINRGGHSIYDKVRMAGYEPKDYIRFYHLRAYDRINAPWPSFIKQMEQNSGVTFHQAQVALAKQWIDVGAQDKVAIKQPEPAQDGLIVENSNSSLEQVSLPPTVEAAVEIVEKFEAGAVGLRDDHHVSDSIAHHSLMDSTSLKQEKWLGTEKEELDSYVSEIIYIHSKLMIVDDRRVIMGSANLNDRSQKGNGDSEIALVVEDMDMVDSRMDNKPYQVSRFATSLRRKLYREHLGLIQPQPVGVETDFMKPAPTPNPDEFGSPEDLTVADPMSLDLEALWNGTAQRNRAIFSELFRSVPSDTVRNFEQYKNYVPKVRAGHLAPDQSLDRVIQRLSEVRGHLVEAPLDFLMEETRLWENTMWSVEFLSFPFDVALVVLLSYELRSILDPDQTDRMRILPREQDKLLLHQAGSLAQKRLARGLKLNLTEATALIASVLQERIRDGDHSVAELMHHGKTLLGRRHVLPGVMHQLHEIQVEGTFPDGVFLVTVHDPICSDSGNIHAALYGSFLPAPADKHFALPEPESLSSIPGAIVVKRNSPIALNQGRSRVQLKVTNTGDRPIQVGSHYHFIETNGALSFDRGLAYGKRLDIAAGTAVRFEPGDSKIVTLCEIAGNKIISGGNRLASGVVDLARTEEVVTALVQKAFGHTPEPGALEVTTDTKISREVYAAMFGPTVGDLVRLGDTPLWIEVERDETRYGDECKFGGGKVIREGMGQATNRSAVECIDLLITNALIVDWSGIYKADIGVKNGLICGIGKAGNPDVMAGVHENLVVGSSTEVIAGEKLIVTAGAIDAHIHFICPQQCEEAIASGSTTFIGGGTGPSAGTSATTCTPSPFYMQHMMAATDTIPLNFLFTGKGNDAGPACLEEIVKAGAGGLKLHEDWGSTPAVITSALDVGDKYDVQINIHTDTLNESGFVDSTIAAFGGRTIHTYHTEGAGGGHAPDIIVVCEHDNVLPSSTNPTRPFAHNTLDEHLDMLMVCHHLDKSIPEDLSFAESRIRGETVAAEDVLHDMGAISMISSDSQAMGRVGEVVSRTWRTAAKMREMRGPLKELGDGKGNKNDNGRVKRYVAKYTINPALTHGISHMVGHIALNTLADLVLWKPENFGTKPEMVLKSGVIAWAQMGDANASIPTVQPVYSRPMWGAKPASAALNSVTFVSEISLTSGTIESYKLSRRFEAVKGCRKVKKKDMKWNSSTPKMTVNAETYAVHADGVLADIAPATALPLTKLYNLF